MVGRPTGPSALILLALTSTTLGAAPLKWRFGREFKGLVVAQHLPAFRRALEGTGLWRLWQDREMRPGLEPTLGPWLATARRYLGTPPEKLLEQPPEELVVGLLPPAMGERRPRLTLLCRMGEAKERVQRVFEFLPSPQAPKAAVPVEIPGFPNSLGWEGGPVVAITEEMFGLGPDEGTLGRLLTKVQPPPKRLVEEPTFLAAMRALGRPDTGKGGVIYAYFDVPALLGVDSEVKTFAFAVEPAGKHIRWRVYLRAPGLGERLFSGGAKALLDEAPSEAFAALALRLKLAQLNLDLSSLLLRMGFIRSNPPPEVAKALEEARAALGDRLLVYLLPPSRKGGEGEPLPRFVLEAGVADQAKLSRALDLINQRLVGEKSSLKLQAEDSAETADIVLYSFSLNLPTRSKPLPILVTSTGNRLLAGLLREDLAAALRARKEERGFLSRPGVVEALGRLTDQNPPLLAYAEGKQFGRWLASLLPHPSEGRKEPGTTPSGPLSGEKGQEACLRNLAKIQAALQRYAEKHEGKLPPSLDELVKAGLLKEEETRCPVSGLKYRYIYYGPNAELREDTIIVYEPTPVHDGEQNFLNMREPQSADAESFQRIIKEIPERLRVGASGRTTPGERPRERGGPVGLLSRLPNFERPDRLANYLPDHAAALTLRPDGLLYTGEEFAVPVEMILGGLGFWETLKGKVESRPQAGPSSIERLRGIAAALNNFAQKNAGRLPSSLKQLVDQKLLAAHLITPPGSPQTYAYLPHRGKTITQVGPDEILVYEPIPRPGDTRAVLFGDGSIKVLDAETFAKAYARSTGRKPPTVPSPRPQPTRPKRPRTPRKVPLEKQLSAWLTLAKTYLEWKRYDRCEEYCRKVLEKARPGSLLEYRAKSLLKRCQEERRAAPGAPYSPR